MINHSVNNYYVVTFVLEVAKPEDKDRSCPRYIDVVSFQYIRCKKSISK